MNDYWNNPPDEGRDPTEEEVTIQTLLESSDLTESVVETIMKIVAGIVDQSIYWSQRDCPACLDRAYRDEKDAAALHTDSGEVA
jgi:hypothetical protein